MMTMQTEIENDKWNPYSLQHGWRKYTPEDNPFILAIQEPVDLYWNNGQITKGSVTANRYLITHGLIYWRLSRQVA